MQCPRCRKEADSVAYSSCPFCGSPTSPPPSSAQSQSQYGGTVRAQVFEIIVRQALAGAPWREICVGPMEVNGISPEEVEAEVARRAGSAARLDLQPMSKLVRVG